MGCGGSTQYGSPVPHVNWNINGKNLADFHFGDTEASSTQHPTDGQGVSAESEHRKNNGATANSVVESSATRLQRSASGAKRFAVSAEPIKEESVTEFVPRYIAKDLNTEEQIKRLLPLNPLFAALETTELDIVVGAMEEEEFAQGTDVLKQGELGTDKFYYIAKGQVGIYKQREGRVTEFGPGQTFGELELMYLNASCAATVHVEGDTPLKAFSIDRGTYRKLVLKLSIKRRKQFQELCSGVPFLKHMTNYETMTLADALMVEHFAKGDAIVSFGDEGKWMYIIVEGEVEVIGRNREGEKHHVCYLGKNETVGELEFLNQHRAVADVLCVKSTKTCKINRTHFEQCMGPIKDYLDRNARENEKYQYYQQQLENFSFGEKEGFRAFSSPIESSFCDDADKQASDAKKGTSSCRRGERGVRRSAVFHKEELDADWCPPVFQKSESELKRITQVLHANPLFRSLEEVDFQTVALAMESFQREQGDILIAEGEEIPFYYVLGEGNVSVFRSGDVVAAFSEGSGVGELELLYENASVATVRVSSACVSGWRLDRGTYKRLVSGIALRRRELYKELLVNIPFLENLSEHERGVLADALQPKNFLPGAFIVQRGSRSEWMYIIVDGTVDVLGVADDDPQGACTEHICFLERGACVGELEFLNQHVAVADCVASTEVRTCTLHRDHFEMCMGPIMDVLRRTVRQEKYEYYNKQVELILGESGTTSGVLPHRFRERAKGISAEADDDTDAPFDPPTFPKTAEQNEQLNPILHKCLLFSSLPPDDLGIIKAAMEPVSFDGGHIIAAKGEPLQYLYCISAGAVDLVERPAEAVVSSEENSVARLFPGDYFGEQQLLYAADLPCTLRSSAESPTTLVFRLDRRTFHRIVASQAAERRRVYASLVTGVSFLAALPPSRQSMLADAFQVAKFPPGAVLIRRGAYSDWMYLVVDGVVEVYGRAARAADSTSEATVENERKICELRRGEMVGELEFLFHHPAVAKCVAKTHVQTLRLHRDHFEMCLGPVAGVIEERLKDPKYEYYNRERQTE